MLLEVAMVSVMVGVVLTLVVQMLLMRWYYSRIPVQVVQDRDQFPVISLPKVLKDKLSKEGKKEGDILEQKEACLWVNLIGQFLFQELRDTSRVRRWVMQKMNFEFAELLQTTSGKLLAHITVRDFSLGTKCPVISGVSVQKAELGEENQLECVDVSMDVDYDGGFTLGVDIMLPFNKQAFISVTVRSLTGRARLQLTRLPYTHWSISFLQEPDVNFDVESHFEGRPLPQVAALIVNQLRRTIRKKHTLPYYKMRFKPLFPLPEMALTPCRLRVNGQCISVGRLCVTFIKCSRLPALSKDTTLYCILSTDMKPWKELVRGQNKVWVTYDVEVNKGQADSIGMTFKDEYLMDRFGMAVMVDLVQTESPAAKADIRKGDVLISVGTTRIVATKQAAKLFKNAGEKFMLRIERPQIKLSQDTKFQEDFISLRDSEVPAADDPLQQDKEEFINISIQPSAGSVGSCSLCVASDNIRDKGSILSNSAAAQLLRPKSATELSSMVPASQRAKGVTADSTTPLSSPRLKRRSVGMTAQAAQNLSAELMSGNNSSSVAPGHRLPLRKDHSPGKDSLRSDSISLDRKQEDEWKSVYSGDSDSDDDSSPVMKTREVPSSQNPRWHDPLSFDLTEQHAYLNVCVWCHNNEQTDVKTDRPTPPPHHDLLLGQVSIPINTVVLQCLMTIQGDSQQTVELRPGQVKAGASRKSWVGHIGFEPHRCYGDITLRFQFTPSNLTKPQRQLFTQNLNPFDPAELTGSGIEIDVNDSSQEELSDGESGTTEGRHMFSKVQFNTATYCNFCGKKIWMKSAFQCSVCDIISHKKCIEKCRAETLCSEDGARRRSAPGEFWRTPAAAARKQVEEEAGTQSPRQQTRSSRILSKLKGAGKADAAKPDNSSQPAKLLPAQEKSKTRERSEPVIPKDLQFLHGTLDDTAMNSAKQLGRQLFSQLEVSERKARLEQMVNKMQIEIDQESSKKTLLTQQKQQADSHSARSAVRLAMAKSNEKIEALMLLLLQYCAGLQHCLDQEEEQRQQAQSALPLMTASLPSTTVGCASLGSSSAVVSGEECSLMLAAVTEEQQTEEAVTQVLAELIHEAEGEPEDDSSSEASDSDAMLVEKFRPIFQSSAVALNNCNSGAPTPAVMQKVKATLEGCLDSDDNEEFEDSTSV